MRFWFVLSLMMGQLVFLSSQNQNTEDRNSLQPSAPAAPSLFLENVFVDAAAGRKATGKKCDPTVVNPCHNPRDVCKGNPPKCQPHHDTNPANIILSEPLDYDDELEEDKPVLFRPNPRPQTTSTTTTTTSPPKRMPPANDVKQNSSKRRRLGFISGRGKGVEGRIGVDYDDEDKFDPNVDQNLDKGEPPHGPPFRGGLSWSGNTHSEAERECLFDHIINEVFYDYHMTAQQKLKWAEDHYDQICDFDKYQVCTSDFDESKEIAEGRFGGGTGGGTGKIDGSYYEEDTSREHGTCRCLDNNMVLINGTCYVPANNGTRSTCGKEYNKIYVPVPDWTMKGPTVELQCVPNATCTTDPTWLGRRCKCKQGYIWVRVNSTCRDETETTIWDVDNIWEFRTLRDILGKSADDKTNNSDLFVDDASSCVILNSSYQILSVSLILILFYKILTFQRVRDG